MAGALLAMEAPAPADLVARLDTPAAYGMDPHTPPAVCLALLSRIGGIPMRWLGPPPDPEAGCGGSGGGFGGAIDGILLAAKGAIRRPAPRTEADIQEAARTGLRMPGTHWVIAGNDVLLGTPAAVAAATARRPGTVTWTRRREPTPSGPARPPIPPGGSGRIPPWVPDTGWWSDQEHPALAAVGWDQDRLADPAASMARAVHELRGPMAMRSMDQGLRWLVMRPAHGYGTELHLDGQAVEEDAEVAQVLRTLRHEPQALPGGGRPGGFLAPFPGPDSGLAIPLRDRSGPVTVEIDTWWHGQDGWLRRACTDRLEFIPHAAGHAATAALPPPTRYPGYADDPTRMALPGTGCSFTVPTSCLETWQDGLLAVADAPDGILDPPREPVPIRRSQPRVWFLVATREGLIDPDRAVLQPDQGGAALELRLRRWLPRPGSRPQAAWAQRLGMGGVPRIGQVVLLHLPMPTLAADARLSVQVRWEDLSDTDGDGLHEARTLFRSGTASACVASDPASPAGSVPRRRSSVPSARGWR
jgi:hypothetical protein